jgi:hypothetical protein
VVAQLNLNEAASIVARLLGKIEGNAKSRQNPNLSVGCLTSFCRQTGFGSLQAGLYLRAI